MTAVQRASVVLFAVILIWPGPVHAQRQVSPLSQLAPRPVLDVPLRPGQLGGYFAGGPAELSAAPALSRGERGALWGGVFLGLTGALIGGALCAESDIQENCLRPVIGFALVGGTIGAVLGALASAAGSSP